MGHSREKQAWGNLTAAAPRTGPELRTGQAVALGEERCGSKNVRRLLEVVVLVSRRAQTVEALEAVRRSPDEVVGAVRRVDMGSGSEEDMAVPDYNHCSRSRSEEGEELPIDPEEAVLRWC